jgi:4-hydroxy-3-methylbut-2-enyl diphosphate reductase
MGLIKKKLNVSPLMQSETLYYKANATPLTRNLGMKIIRAAHLGMCFGVRDAIALAKESSQARPLTILGELAHNPSVVADLKTAGLLMEDRVANVTTAAVMITAHGASEKQMARLRQRGLDVLEATCPLVHHAHQMVRQLVAQNFYPVIIGQREHVEVRGLTEDLAEFDVVLTPQDVEQLAQRPRFGVAAQTTQPIDKVRAMVDLIRRRFPASEVRFVDTVCQPTKLRQSAALELARQSDVVIVIGGANSNNTRELVAACRRVCAAVYHVQQAGDLRAEWLEGAQTVGITAGTSSPDWIIAEVESRLEVLAAALLRQSDAASSPEKTLFEPKPATPFKFPSCA